MSMRGVPEPQARGRQRTTVKIAHLAWVGSFHIAYQIGLGPRVLHWAYSRRLGSSAGPFGPDVGGEDAEGQERAARGGAEEEDDGQGR